MIQIAADTPQFLFGDASVNQDPHAMPMSLRELLYGADETFRNRVYSELGEYALMRIAAEPDIRYLDVVFTIESHRYARSGVRAEFAIMDICDLGPNPHEQ